MELARLSAEKGYGIFLLGSTDANAQESMRVLRERFPGVNFVGQYSPAPAPLDQMDDAEILRRIHEARPHILLVAFGNPKQEFWIHRNLEKLRVPVSIGIGGTLEMIAGTRKRAPRWVQHVNMEWAYRMMQEPARLLPRYFHDFAALLRYLPREVIAQRMQTRKHSSDSIRIFQDQGDVIVMVRGVLTGLLCTQIRDIVSDAAQHHDSVTVDLADASGVEADGLGCLLDARRSLQSHGLDLYIVSPNGSVRRVIDASALRSLLFAPEIKKPVQTSASATSSAAQEDMMPAVDRLSA